jgi:hypothetical protein
VVELAVRQPGGGAGTDAEASPQPPRARKAATAFVAAPRTTAPGLLAARTAGFLAPASWAARFFAARPTGRLLAASAWRPRFLRGAGGARRLVTEPAAPDAVEAAADAVDDVVTGAASRRSGARCTGADSAGGAASGRSRPAAGEHLVEGFGDLLVGRELVA